MNPNIKILGMQWYGKTAMFNLVRGANADENEPKIQNYVSGVARMVEYWTLDGYDVDYEWNDPSENEIGTLFQKRLGFCISYERSSTTSVKDFIVHCMSRSLPLQHLTSPVKPLKGLDKGTHRPHNIQSPNRSTG